MQIDRQREQTQALHHLLLLCFYEESKRPACAKSQIQGISMVFWLKHRFLNKFFEFIVQECYKL
jgi:hypothetical protein